MVQNCEKILIRYICWQKLKSSDEDDGNGQIAYLDRLEVDCGMDRAISKIQLVRKPGNRLAYEYSCMDATDGNQLICRDARTKPENEAGGGRAIEYLDRHDIACEKDEVRTSNCCCVIC